MKHPSLTSFAPPLFLAQEVFQAFFRKWAVFYSFAEKDRGLDPYDAPCVCTPVVLDFMT